MEFPEQNSAFGEFLSFGDRHPGLIESVLRLGAADSPGLVVPVLLVPTLPASSSSLILYTPPSYRGTVPMGSLFLFLATCNMPGCELYKQHTCKDHN